MIVDLPQEVIFRSLERKAVPFQGHLHLTERCNLKCFHCYRIGLPWSGGMGTKEWIRLLHEFRDEGTMDLTFSGGEPLLHPGWREIIGTAARLGFQIDLFQNGTVIKKDDIRFLKDCRIRELSFSIHGIDEIHDRFVARPGAFRRAWPMVEYSRSVGLKTVIKMSVMRPTWPSIEELARRCREIGAVFAPSYNMIPRFVPGNDGFLSETLTADQIRTFEKRYPEWTGRPELSRCEDEPAPATCNMGWARFAVGPRGDLYPCSQVAEPVDNIRYKPFRQAWRYSFRLNEIRASAGKPLETCRSCELVKKCKYRCMGHFQLVTGKFDEPAPEHCRITAAWAGYDEIPTELVPLGKKDGERKEAVG